MYVLQSFTFSLDNINVESYADSRASCTKFESGCSIRYIEMRNGKPVPTTVAIAIVRIVITIAKIIFGLKILMNLI